MHIVSWWKNLNLGQKVGIMLIIALIINTVVHVSHPAYRYYREHLAALDRRYSDALRQVDANMRTNLVPHVFGVLSNSVYQLRALSSMQRDIDYGYVSNAIAQVYADIDAYMQDMQVSTLSYRDDSCTVITVDGHSWRNGHDVGVYVDGYIYRLGDRWRGSEVVEIGNGYFRTVDTVVVLRRKFEDNSNINLSKSEV